MQSYHSIEEEECVIQCVEENLKHNPKRPFHKYEGCPTNVPEGYHYYPGFTFNGITLPPILIKFGGGPLKLYNYRFVVKDKDKVEKDKDGNVVPKVRVLQLENSDPVEFKAHPGKILQKKSEAKSGSWKDLVVMQRAGVYMHDRVRNDWRQGDICSFLINSATLNKLYFVKDYVTMIFAHLPEDATTASRLELEVANGTCAVVRAIAVGSDSILFRIQLTPTLSSFCSTSSSPAAAASDPMVALASQQQQQQQLLHAGTVQPNQGVGQVAANGFNFQDLSNGYAPFLLPPGAPTNPHPRGLVPQQQQQQPLFPVLHQQQQQPQEELPGFRGIMVRRHRGAVVCPSRLSLLSALFLSSILILTHSISFSPTHSFSVRSECNTRWPQRSSSSSSSSTTNITTRNNNRRPNISTSRSKISINNRRPNISTSTSRCKIIVKGCSNSNSHSRSRRSLR